MEACLLTHETTEPLKRPWNPDMGVHLDENAFCSVYVDLEQARLVERGVEQRQKALRPKNFP